MPPRSTDRCYGTLTRLPGARGQSRSAWHITAEPHVMIRLKRIFPRAQWTRTGAIMRDDTPDVARDIDWIQHRWPLDSDKRRCRYSPSRRRCPPWWSP
jgi:hypothetical protein